jgi:hypothetical protein
MCQESPLTPLDQRAIVGRSFPTLYPLGLWHETSLFQPFSTLLPDNQVAAARSSALRALASLTPDKPKPTGDLVITLQQVQSVWSQAKQQQHGLISRPSWP